MRKRQEIHFKKLIEKFPFLYQVSSMWLYECPPEAQNPTVELLSEPFPAWEDGAVWVRQTWDEGESTWRPRFNPHPIGRSIGQVIYDHYVAADREDADDESEGTRVSDIILCTQGNGLEEVGRLAFNIVLIPSRPNLPLHEFIREHFGH